MRYVLMIEAQQGLSYADQLAIARRAEAAGFEALFRSDHYESFPGSAGRPTTDAWTVLAGLARDTERIRLGVLVSPVTFRPPGHVREGRRDGPRDERRSRRGRPRRRLERGRAPPPRRRRSRRSPSGPTCSRSSWRSSTACGRSPTAGRSAGRHYRVEDTVFQPQARSRRPPIIVGGEGSPRSLRIAARYADEFNVTSSDPARVADRMARLDEACRAIGRDPATIRRSAMVGTLDRRATPASWPRGRPRSWPR